VVDATEMAVLGELFPFRLMQLGFRLFQVMDETEHDQFRYILPPVCLVPAGSFVMGSDHPRSDLEKSNETPQHTVRLEAYYIGVYPLTVTEYACFMQATHAPEPDAWSTQQQRLDHPAVWISWNQVHAYTCWITQVTGEAW